MSFVILISVYTRFETGVISLAISIARFATGPPCGFMLAIDAMECGISVHTNDSSFELVIRISSR